MISPRAKLGQINRRRSGGYELEKEGDFFLQPDPTLVVHLLRAGMKGVC